MSVAFEQRTDLVEKRKWKWFLTTNKHYQYSCLIDLHLNELFALL